METKDYPAYLKTQTDADLLSIRASLDRRSFPNRLGMVEKEIEFRKEHPRQRERDPAPIPTKTGRATTGIKPRDVMAITVAILVPGHFALVFGGNAWFGKEVFQQGILAHVGLPCFMAGAVGGWLFTRKWYIPILCGGWCPASILYLFTAGWLEHGHGLLHPPRYLATPALILGAFTTGCLVPMLVRRFLVSVACPVIGVVRKDMKHILTRIVVLASCACMLVGLVPWDGLPRWFRIVLGIANFLVIVADLCVPWSWFVGDDDRKGREETDHDT